MTGCLIALIALVVSGVGALMAGRGRTPSVIAAAGVVVAAACVLPSAVLALLGQPPADVEITWAAPVEHVRLGLDALSAFFVVPLMVLGAICGVYGAVYLDDQRGRRWLAAPACFFNVLVAAMLLVLLARDAIVFVVAWETMTVASYLLVTFDHTQVEVRQAGWVYVIASHLGVACILSSFLLLGQYGLSFADFAAHPLGGAAAAVAGVLGLVGFGVKAGIVPLHVWLPEAHAAAPSHVSALMSGVLIKLGVYGILRTITFVGAGLPWGPLLLGLGVTGALVGISLALYQRDLKRVLAYSSVENIGVVLVGLGLGFWGASNGHPQIAALGLYGGLFHIWNHAVMKGLMFLGAGSVLHGSSTRDLEQMGGLMKRMPRTGTLLVIGAIAIAALPPLNGFASEWLLYLGLARSGGAPDGSLLLLFAVAVLATVGVLAVLCFVRWIGIGLLGQPRSWAADGAHESGIGLVGPIAVLATIAIALPFVMPALAPALDPVVAALVPGAAAGGAVGEMLAPIVILSAALWIGIAIAYLVGRRLVRRRRSAGTWGCGYAVPSPRMQYSGAAFAEGIHRLLPRALRAKIDVQYSTELFPSPEQLTVDRQDPFTRAAYEPFADRLARQFAQLRWVQQGRLHLYLLYIVLTVIGTITVVSIRDWWLLP